MQKLNSNYVRELHLNQIYELVRLKGPVSRVTLSEMVCLSPTSVGKMMKELIEEGFVREIGEVSGNLGRKATLLDIVPNRMRAIGISLREGEIRAGVVNIRGEILQKKRLAVEDKSYIHVVEQIKSLIDELSDFCHRQSGGSPVKLPVGIGVNVSASAEYQTGTVISWPEFGWKNIPLKALLQRSYPYPVWVDNQAKAESKAVKLFGQVNDRQEYMMVHLDDEISVVRMLGGTLMRGANHLEGEIGHMIIDPNGALCKCGRKGCLNTKIGRGALEQRLGMSFGEMVRRYREGDVRCVEELNIISNELALWIANAAIMYDPPEIILTGSMVDECSELYEQIAYKHKRFLLPNIQSRMLLSKCSIPYTDMHYISSAANVFYKLSVAAMH